MIMSLQTIVVYMKFSKVVHHQQLRRHAFLCVWNFACRVHIIIRIQMKCETYGILKSFSNLRVLYCTQNFFKYIKLDQNTPSIFRVLQDSGIMIVFKWFFLFKRFSIKFCILKPNRCFSIGWVSPLKTGPQSKKGVRKKMIPKLK